MNTKFFKANNNIKIRRNKFMEYKKQSIRNLRRPKGHISSVGTNYIHERNPWVISFWSMVFPGLGYILLGSFLRGYILIIWEIAINYFAKINTAIYYSFTGQFELAKNILDKRWVVLYVGIYVYAIWDSYRSTINQNKLSLLADREGSQILPFKIDAFEVNFFDKREPWVAAAWSLFMPGVGHLYVNRLPAGIIIIIWWIIIIYFSHAFEALIFTALGDYNYAKQITNIQWLLNIPSIYIFSIYNSYVHTVENNKLFDIEQSRFLKDNYQCSKFQMPI